MPSDPTPPGPWRHRLSVPPLDLPRYRRLQAAVMAPYLRGRPLRRLALIVAVCLPVGLLLGFLIGWTGTHVTMSIETRRPAFDAWLDGRDVGIALFGLVMLILVTMRAVTRAWQTRLLRRIHADVNGLHVDHDLRLGDEGLEWSDADGTLALRWSGVRALIRDGDAHYLVLPGPSAIWLPDAALEGRPDRDAILDYIRGRIAAARGTAARP